MYSDDRDPFVAHDLVVLVDRVPTTGVGSRGRRDAGLIKRNADGATTPITAAAGRAGDTSATAALADHAEAIRALARRVITDVIEIGSRLTECKTRLKHGRWLSWLDEEFGWSADTAANYIRIYKLTQEEEFKYRNFRNLNIGVSALYLISQQSVPAEVRTEIIERAEAGEDLPVAKVKSVIRRNKQPGKGKRAKAESIWQESEQQWRAAWQAEGRSLTDYEAGLSNTKSEVWDWRRAKGAASIEAENAAWLRDHPGNPLPKHLCSLSEAEGAEYDAWLKKYWAETTAPGGNGVDVDRSAEARKQAAADEAVEATKPVTAPEPPPAEATSEAGGGDGELALLREFARLVIERATAIKFEPKDHAKFKVLRDRVKQAISGGQS